MKVSFLLNHKRELLIEINCSFGEITDINGKTRYKYCAGIHNGEGIQRFSRGLGHRDGRPGFNQFELDKVSLDNERYLKTETFIIAKLPLNNYLQLANFKL